MMPDNQDDEIFEDIYREFAEKDRISSEKQHSKKKKHIKWDMVAIVVMIIILTALLIYLILNFQNEREAKPNIPSESIIASDISDSDEPSDKDSSILGSDESDISSEPTVTEAPKPPYPVDADITVIDGATYINGILIINKTYSVPDTFDPGVNPIADAKLQEMYAAAAADGISLWTASGYRTYQYQKQLYENYGARDGFEAADTYSARPGFSEHESGLAFDVNDPSNSFDDTAEAQWLKEHCAEYGFIIRYPEGKEDITGFMYESWHIRYVGEDIAAVIMENEICLEEYFGITSEYGYDYAEQIIDN